MIALVVTTLFEYAAMKGAFRNKFDGTNDEVVQEVLQTEVSKLKAKFK